MIPVFFQELCDSPQKLAASHIDQQAGVRDCEFRNSDDVFFNLLNYYRENAMHVQRLSKKVEKEVSGSDCNELRTTSIVRSIFGGSSRGTRWMSDTA